MASSLALKRLVSSNLIPTKLRLIRPITTVPSGSRLFNTDALREFYSDDDGRDIEGDRRSGRVISRRRDDLSEGVDPFWPSRSLSQILNMVDQIVDNPYISASRGLGSGLRRAFDVSETDDALNLRIDMPGLDKEDVKVSVEQNTLVIKGEGAKESDEEESGRRYTSRIDLPEKIFKTNEIKAEMKNGVLKLVVPKVKEEDRTDVFHVKIE